MQNYSKPSFFVFLQKYPKPFVTSLNQKLQQVGVETVYRKNWFLISNTQKEQGGGVPSLKIARIMLGGLTWVMSTSCLPSLVAAFFWALVGV